MRYFAADATTYEAVRSGLDAAFGHPGPSAQTCVEPAATAPRDEDGRVVLAVVDEFIALEAVQSVMPDLLSSGAVDEITAEEYLAAVPASRP